MGELTGIEFPAAHGKSRIATFRAPDGVLECEVFCDRKRLVGPAKMIGERALGELVEVVRARSGR